MNTLGDLFLLFVGAAAGAVGAAGVIAVCLCGAEADRKRRASLRELERTQELEGARALAALWKREALLARSEAERLGNVLDGKPPYFPRPLSRR